MRAQDHIVAISIAALAALAVTPAIASPAYPGIVKDTLGAECVPSCTICHATTAGGPYTVKKKFGLALMSTPFGLMSKNEDQLRAVLNAFENTDQTRQEAGFPPFDLADCATYQGDVAINDDPTGQGRWVIGELLWLNGDTDCDGENDVMELRDGRDPNTKGEGNLCALYGCGASSIDPHPNGDPTPFLAAVGVAGLLGAIWRRRQKVLR